MGNEVLVQKPLAVAPVPNNSFTTGRSDSVTAVTWFSCLERPAGALWSPADRTSAQHFSCTSFLVVGTSEGYIQLHLEDGRPIFRQRFHDRPVLSFQLRSWRMGTYVTCTCSGCFAFTSKYRHCYGNAGTGTEPAYEDLMVTFNDMLVRVAAAEVQATFQLCVDERNVQDVPPLAFQKWQMSKLCGPRSTALCLGLQTRDLYHVLQEAQAEHWAKLHIITGGSVPPLSSFEAIEPGQRSTLGYIADVASNLATGVFSLAKTAQAEVARRQTALTTGLRSFLVQSVFGAHAHERSSAVVSHDNAHMLSVAETPQAWRAVPEDGRTITAMLPAPRGCLVAATDNLGRVLLLDGPSLTVIHLWKGYRDCQCAWLELPSPDCGPTTPAAQPNAGQQTMLLLAVLAPRRQVVDVWRCPQCCKVAAIDVPDHCRLLQCPVLLGTSAAFCSVPGDGGTAPWMANCCILDGGTGRLLDVGEALADSMNDVTSELAKDSTRDSAQEL